MTSSDCVDDSQILSPARRWGALISLLGATFVGTVNNSVANVALPSIADHFEVDLTTAVWVVSGFVIALGTTMPLAGRLGDLFGQRRIFLAGVGVFAVASMVVGLAQNMEIVVLGRVLQGASGAPVLPCVMATIVRIFPREHRGRAVGLWAAVNSGALALGPAVGGAVVEAAGWRALFLLSAPAIVIVGVLVAILVPSEGAIRRQPIDLAGAALVMLVLFGCVAPISLGSRWGWTHPGIIVLVAMVVAAGTTLSRHLRHTANPFIDPGLIRHPMFVTTTAVAGLQMITLFALTFTVPVFLIEGRDFGAGSAGLVTSVLAGSMFAGATVSGRLAERWPFHILALVGGSSILVGCSALIVGGQRISSIVVALIICGFGISMIQAPAAVAITISVPPAQTGVATGLFNTARFVFGGIGATIAALVYESGTEGGGSVITAFRMAILVGMVPGLVIVALASLFLRPTSSGQRRADVAAGSTAR